MEIQKPLKIKIVTLNLKIESKATNENEISKLL